MASPKGTTALWVTHRFEELEYADGAVYMEDGRVVLQGDASTIRSFVESKHASYVKQISSWIINNIMYFHGISIYISIPAFTH